MLCGVFLINFGYNPKFQVSEYVKERIIALREQHPGQVRVDKLMRGFWYSFPSKIYIVGK